MNHSVHLLSGQYISKRSTRLDQSLHLQSVHTSLQINTPPTDEHTPFRSIHLQSIDASVTTQHISSTSIRRRPQRHVDPRQSTGTGSEHSPLNRSRKWRPTYQHAVSKLGKGVRVLTFSRRSTSYALQGREREREREREADRSHTAPSSGSRG